MAVKVRKPKDIKVSDHEAHISRNLEIEQAYVIGTFLNAEECETLGKWLIKASKYLNNRSGK